MRRSEITEDIYENVMMRTGREEMVRGGRVEMMVDIYESDHDHLDMRTNTESHQSLQHTGSVSVKNRKPRATEVCLCLLCVLLLTAVIVLCVCYTNERKHINNLIEERKLELKRVRDQMDQILHAFEDIFQLDDNSKWLYHNFSFYYISSEKKGWSDSRRYCQQRGADLLIINSPEEQDFFQKNVADQFWIGLIKTGQVWKWNDNTTLTNEYWETQSRDTIRYFLCSVMTSSGWKAEDCTKTNKWICKRPILV